MFIRKKLNKSGIVSVQVINKSSGRYKVRKTIGSSSDPDLTERLVKEGEKWIENYLGQMDMFSYLDKQEEEKRVINLLLSNIENILINGSQIILDKVYKSIGFDKINDDVLKHIVISRLSQPMSKSATVEYLKAYFDEDIHYQKIYRYMDQLDGQVQEEIQKISVEHTRKILGDQIGLIFYDVTTLYFESNKKDDLREVGFSKDGKHSHVQVVLGLLVSKGGYPLSYSLFNGSQFEGYTMLPVVEDFITRFKLKDFVIVADSGLMSKTNIELLDSAGYKYIIGARIKSESQQIKRWILSLDKSTGTFYEHNKEKGRLIVGYSEKRAKMDAYNREKGLSRLRKAFKSGKITKENINKRGYNKFLDITQGIEVSINQQKVKEDEQWDGLKGYFTNTDLPAKEVYESYRGLWVIENAFRVTKGTIQLRPMFHFTPKRIKAHVAICFVAYKVYKELERILKTKQIELSPDKVIDIAKTITTIKIKLPISGEIMTRTMMITERQQSIAELIEQPI
jgi:transposase